MPSSSLQTFSKHSKMKYNLQADLLCWMDGGCPSWRRRYHVHGNNLGLPYDDFICEVAILPSWLKKVITTVFLGYYNRYCVIRYNIIAPNWSNRRDCLCSVLLWWCKNETCPQNKVANNAYYSLRRKRTCFNQLLWQGQRVNSPWTKVLSCWKISGPNWYCYRPATKWCSSSASIMPNTLTAVSLVVFWYILDIQTSACLPKCHENNTN